MLLTYIELQALVEQGAVQAPLDQLNGASIDLTLGDSLLVEGPGRHPVDLARKQSPNFIELLPDESGRWRLRPGDFALVNTREVFNLPDDVAFAMRLKSSTARAGLNASLAGWADPGWTGGTLTIQIKNLLSRHELILTPNMKIAQAIFHRGEPVPSEKSYAVTGHYNNTLKPTAARGI